MAIFAAKYQQFPLDEDGGMFYLQTLGYRAVIMTYRRQKDIAFRLPCIIQALQDEDTFFFLSKEDGLLILFTGRSTAASSRVLFQSPIYLSICISLRSIRRRERNFNLIPYRKRRRRSHSFFSHHFYYELAAPFCPLTRGQSTECAATPQF